jgi:divalent metal cation (Fe/Co/Zn/Cd) transporter
MFVHVQQVNELVAEVPEVEGIQCVITREEQKDILTMRVATARALSPEEVEEFSRRAREKIKVKVNRVELVPIDVVRGKPVFDDQRVWD